MALTTIIPGAQVSYTGSVSGYLQTPGTIQPDQEDGLIRILWADGFSLSILSPGDPLLANLSAVAAPPSS